MTLLRFKKKKSITSIRAYVLCPIVFVTRDLLFAYLLFMRFSSECISKLRFWNGRLRTKINKNKPREKLVFFSYFLSRSTQREYFPYTKFNKEQKYMKLYSNDGIEIALGHLGVDLPETDKVYRCLSTEDKSERYQQHEDDDDTTTSSGAATSLCFEWMEHARIQLNYERRYGQLNCYNIKWYSLSDKIEPTDCYEDGYQYGHW